MSRTTYLDIIIFILVGLIPTTKVFFYSTCDLRQRKRDLFLSVESTIDELKVHLLGRKTPIRSQKPREVVQEVYGWLLGHWACRSLMFQIAEHAQISPLRLGFTGALNVVRRAIPKFQCVEPE